MLTSIVTTLLAATTQQANPRHHNNREPIYQLLRQDTRRGTNLSTHALDGHQHLIPLNETSCRCSTSAPHRAALRHAGGFATAAERFGTVPLADLVAPAAALAREGVVINSSQAYVFEILEPIYSATPEARELFMPDGRRPTTGDLFTDPPLGDTLERLGAEGAAPFYEGDLAAAISDYVRAQGGVLTHADLAATAPKPREPVHVHYRGRDVLTNPPPSAGGTLLAYALALLEREDGPPACSRSCGDGARPGRAHAGVPHRPAEPGFLARFMAQPARLDHAHLGARRRRLGVRGDVHERRGLRHRRARHRHARQQHDGRAGPLARSASSRTRRAAGCRR